MLEIRQVMGTGSWTPRVYTLIFLNVWPKTAPLARRRQPGIDTHSALHNNHIRSNVM